MAKFNPEMYRDSFIQYVLNLLQHPVLYAEWVSENNEPDEDLASNIQDAVYEYQNLIHLRPMACSGWLAKVLKWAYSNRDGLLKELADYHNDMFFGRGITCFDFRETVERALQELDHLREGYLQAVVPKDVEQVFDETECQIEQEHKQRLDAYLDPPKTNFAQGAQPTALPFSELQPGQAFRYRSRSEEEVYIKLFHAYTKKRAEYVSLKTGIVYCTTSNVPVFPVQAQLLVD